MTKLTILISASDAPLFQSPATAQDALQAYIEVARRQGERRVDIKLPDLTTVYTVNAHL